MSTEIASPEGQRLANNRYQVLQKLGEGGMATVYKARDNNLDADVVIKIPKAALLADPEYSKRFTREIRALVKLNHPHVVKVLDVGEQDGVPFVVMQYLTGGSLQDQCTAKDGLRSSGPLAALPAWLDKVSSALDFIHKEGYVHRDVKPANILFDGHGNAYLGDFGIAKVLAADHDMKQSVSLTGTGVVLGTPAYMGPEFVMGLPYDGRIDQYALAVTVFEIMTGRTPFEATTPGAMLVKQTTEAPKPLAELLPGVTRELSLAVQKGLEKDPKHRFPTCCAFAEAVLRGYGNSIAPGPRISSGMRPTDAPVSQQTVPHGPATPSRPPPIQRFTPAHTVSPTPVRISTPIQGTRLSGSQIVRPAAPLVRAQKPSSKAPLIVGGVVVLAAVAGGAFFFLKEGADKNPTPASGGKVEGANNDVSKGANKPIASTPLPSGSAPKGQVRAFAGHTGEIRFLAVEPNGRRMLSGSLDRTVRLWDVETGRELATVKMENAKDIPLAAEFLRDEPNRIRIGTSQSVFVYDLDSKRPGKTIRLPREADALAFFPDGRRFCIGTDRSLEIWDLDSEEMKGRLSESTVPPVRSLFISPDNRTVVSGHAANSESKAPVCTWDADRRQRLKTFDGHSSDVTSVAITQDGKHLLSAGFDGIRLWDTDRADYPHLYEFIRGGFRAILKEAGTQTPIKLRMGVAFSPDGKRAALGVGGIVSYQDIIDGKQVCDFNGHSDEIVECVAFSSDGSRVFSAGGDKLVRMWAVPR